MLLSILASIVGLLGSVAPNIVNIFSRKQELQHEIQLEQLKQTSANRDADLEALLASVREGESLRAHDSTLDGGIFLNALRASIRPVITYSFFAVFIIVKISGAYIMMTTGDSIPAMFLAVWDDNTAGLFATIISFWFGSRIFEKFIDINK